MRAMKVVAISCLTCLAVIVTFFEASYINEDRLCGYRIEADFHSGKTRRRTYLLFIPIHSTVTTNLVSTSAPGATELWTPVDRRPILGGSFDNTRPGDLAAIGVINKLLTEQGLTDAQKRGIATNLIGRLQTMRSIDVIKWAQAELATNYFRLHPLLEN